MGLASSTSLHLSVQEGNILNIIQKLENSLEEAEKKIKRQKIAKLRNMEERM